MTLEQKLVAHAVSLDFDDLPSQAVDSARREVLWTFASMVAGSQDQGSDRVLDFVRSISGGRDGHATIVGSGSNYSVDIAGFANGVYAKALEYEDKHWIGNSHAYAVGVAVVPAAFAMAEHIGGISGRDL